MSKSPDKTIVIFGCGGHAASAAETVLSAGFEIDYFVDPQKEGQTYLDYPVRGDIENTSSPLSIVIAVGDNVQRQRLASQIKEAHPDAFFPAIIHRDASVSRFAEIGEGTLIMQKSVLGARAEVGRFCIVNSSSSLDHDGKMHDFSSLAPGVITGGTVTIGAGAAIGIGAVLRHNINVGEDTLIGAQSYVHEDAPPGSVLWGTPAKIIGSRDKNKPYL